jgi:hypothetical protein
MNHWSEKWCEILYGDAYCASNVFVLVARIGEIRKAQKTSVGKPEVD